MEIEGDLHTPRRSPQRVPDSQPDQITFEALLQPTKLMNSCSGIVSPGRAWGRSPTKFGSYAIVARPGFQREYKELPEENNFNKEELKGEEEEDPNPYDCNFDVDASAHASHKDLKVTLAHMPKVIEVINSSMREKSLTIDKDIIVG